MQPVGLGESDAILGAMREVASAGGSSLTAADTASILAAARYLLRREGLTDIATLVAVRPADLAVALTQRELRHEAVKYLTVMALVDGAIDKAKVARVLDYACALDVEESYLTEIVEAASGHMAWSLADMTRQNMESITNKPWGDRDPMPWLLPYAGDKADPGLAERYEALGKLPDNSFGKALWRFYKKNGYAFPGEPAALNEAFGTSHDSAHVIAGYDTSARGEILVSTFTAAMHPVNPMAGHILPVIFSWHLDIKINDVAKSTSGGLDPDEFWHAWARGREIKADTFAPGWQVWDWVERDLQELRRELELSSPPVDLVLTDQPPTDMRDLLIKGISTVKEARLGPSGSRPLAILIQQDGKTVGGLLGRTGYRRLTVELLFVPEALRGQGMGAKLLAQAEAEAKKRGCIGAWLETFSPDAHRFYLRRGFKTFGEIADYPPGNTRYFVAKDWSL